MELEPLQITSTDSCSSVFVAGWLLVFCFVLTIVYPLTSLYEIVFHAVPLLMRAHGLRVLLLSVYSVLFTAVAVLSVIAGLKLWLVRPDAVRFAKRYLGTYLVANVLYFVFWFALTRPTQSLSLAQMGWYHVVGPMPFTYLWYTYLEHSKRVRNTYPQR